MTVTVFSLYIMVCICLHVCVWNLLWCPHFWGSWRKRSRWRAAAAGAATTAAAAAAAANACTAFSAHRQGRNTLRNTLTSQEDLSQSSYGGIQFRPKSPELPSNPENLSPNSGKAQVGPKLGPKTVVGPKRNYVDRKDPLPRQQLREISGVKLM